MATNPAVTAAISALQTAFNADEAADDKALADAVSALGAAQANDAADKAEKTRLADLLRKAGIDPTTGNPIPPVTPPGSPATTVIAVATTPDPTGIKATITVDGRLHHYERRSGTTVVWSSVGTPSNPTPDARTVEFTYLLEGQVVTFAGFPLLADGTAGTPFTRTFTATTGATVPPVVPPATKTAFRLGLYTDNVVAAAAAFGRDIAQHDVVTVHRFLAGDAAADTMTSFLDAEGIGAWLAIDPNHEFVCAYQAFYGHGSSDWDNPALDANAVAWANVVTAKAAQYKFNPKQVVNRLMHEGNGDWGFGQARYGGDQTAGFIRAWRRIRLAVRAVQPAIEFDWNNVAFAYGSVYDPRPCYPGDDVVDRVSFDFYGDYGDFSTKLPQLRDCAAFAAEHKKRWGIDEWCLCRSTNGRGGTDDDAGFVTDTLDALRDLGGGWLLIFNESWNFETQGTFEQISRDGGGKAILALQAGLRTFPVAA